MMCCEGIPASCPLGYQPGVFEQKMECGSQGLEYLLDFVLKQKEKSSVLLVFQMI